MNSVDVSVHDVDQTAPPNDFISPWLTQFCYDTFIGLY